MKNIEKYIIVILSFIALGAIGTAVYFGVNNKHLKEQDTIVEVDKQETNKKEDLNDENIDTDDNRSVELYPKYITNNFDKTRPYYTDLSGSFYHNNYYYDKVYIKNLSNESKLSLILNLLIINQSCVGTDDYCVISKDLYDSLYIELFGEKPNIYNFKSDDVAYEIEYIKDLNELHVKFFPLGDEACNSSHEQLISQNSYADRIEYITAVFYIDSCDEKTKLCSDENCKNIINSFQEYEGDLLKKETIKNQDKFDKYKYTFKYSEEFNTYYFYSVEKVK